MLVGEAGIDIVIDDPKFLTYLWPKNICGSYGDLVLGWVVEVNHRPLVMKVEKLTKKM